MKEGLFFILFLIGLSSVCDTITQLFLKFSINSLKFSASSNLLNILKFILKLILMPRLWLAGLFSLLSLCIWLFVLSKSDLNFAFSLDSMHYLFIAFASRLVLKEKVCFRRWLGTLLVVTGIVIVSIS